MLQVFYHRNLLSSHKNNKTKMTKCTAFFFLPLSILRATTAAAAVGADQLSAFVWLTDAHYDEFYSTKNAKVHLDNAPCGLGGDSPLCSAFGCGSSSTLVTSAIANAASASADLGYAKPDFILFTGNSTRHSDDGLPANIYVVVEDAMSFVGSLFEEYFPEVPLVQLPAPDLGNNNLPGDYELNVTSLEPCFPSDDGQPPNATNPWLERMATKFRSVFVSDEEAAVFACGGYVNRMVVPNLYIISLNTAVWSLKHTPAVDPAGADAFSQHEWLEEQLSEARLNGDKVYITGHIPPMLQSFTGSLGSPLWQPPHLERYMEAVDKYQDVVASQLFGHVHSNELRVAETMPDDAPPMIILGSICPCYTTDPSLNVVLYDGGDSKRLVDVVTYQLDITAHANETMASASSNSGDIVMWDRKFDNLTGFLGMEALTNREIWLLSERMVEDDATFNAYLNVWYKGVSQEKGCLTVADCRRKEACLLPCGATNETWQACLVDDAAICTLGDTGAGSGKDIIASSSSGAIPNRGSPLPLLLFALFAASSVGTVSCAL